jgi:AcrR family transcriptional regulator
MVRLASPTPSTEAGGAKARILDAVVAIAHATGLRKLAMDEIAREAHVGRATLYKHFSGRDALVKAAVRAELDKFFRELEGTVRRYDDQDERIVHSFAHAYRLLDEHPALAPILRLNPDLLLPYVVTPSSSALNRGTEFITSFLDDGYLSPRQAKRFAEHTARQFHTLTLISETDLGLRDPGGAEQYARDFLLPVLHRLHLDDAL